MAYKKPKDFKNKRKHLFQRLNLNGFEEYYKANQSWEKTMWATAIIALYTFALFLVVTYIRKCLSFTSVVDVKEHPHPKFQFPVIEVCHAGNMNKTFVMENIVIPNSTFKKIVDMQIMQADIFSDFARYLRLYSFASTSIVGDFDEDRWELLTEIFNYNFGSPRNLEYADFIADTAYRGKALFRNCEFGGQKVQCDQVQFTFDTPSCYVLLLNGRDEMIETSVTDSPMRTGFNFDMILPTNFTFDEADTPESFGSSQMGVSVFLASSPNPFAPMMAFPGNTRAIIEIQSTEMKLTSDCYRTPPQLDSSRNPISQEAYYNEAACLVEIIQNLTQKLCNCYFIAGTVFPRNAPYLRREGPVDPPVCTPSHVRGCMSGVYMNTTSNDENYRAATVGVCKRLCVDYRFDATVSYFDLEPKNSDVKINRFSIFYYSKRQFLNSERQLSTVHDFLVNIGVAIGVYTGISVAATLQALAILGIAGYDFMERKWVKPMLSHFLSLRYPLAIEYKTDSNSEKWAWKNNRIAVAS